MSTITKGKTFSSTETVTNAKLHTLVDSASISGIVDSEIAAGAAIADTKLATISTTGKVNTDALTTGSDAQGDILYHNGTKWTRLGYGTSGQVLKTGGSGANPSWSSGDGTYLTVSGGNLTLGTIFGAWATDLEPAGGGGSAAIATDTVYEASTDGLVVGWIEDSGNSVDIELYTDGSNPPTTIVRKFKQLNELSTTSYIDFQMPVKKGDYWKIVDNYSATTPNYEIRWLPIGS